MRLLIFVVLALLTGCASRPPHPPITEPIALGSPYWQCDGRGDCELAQGWQPSQLSPVGCWLHEAVFFHRPMECKQFTGCTPWLTPRYCSIEHIARSGDAEINCKLQARVLAKCRAEIKGSK
jgi:hypothetical protein